MGNSRGLHNLVTDTMEGQVGSALLIKILNRLGACSSADTLARYIQHKSTNRKNTMDLCLDQHSFTVISADNIDFQNAYAIVVKGKKTTSWHGTSIQAVQPLPSLLNSMNTLVWRSTKNR